MQVKAPELKAKLEAKLAQAIAALEDIQRRDEELVRRTASTDSWPAVPCV